MELGMATELAEPRAKWKLRASYSKIIKEFKMVTVEHSMDCAPFSVRSLE